MCIRKVVKFAIFMPLQNVLDVIYYDLSGDSSQYVELLLTM